MAESDRSPLLIWLALLGVVTGVGLWVILGLGGEEPGESEVSPQGTSAQIAPPVLGEEFSPPGASGTGGDSALRNEPVEVDPSGGGPSGVAVADEDDEPPVFRPAGDPQTLAAEAESLLTAGRYDEARDRAVDCLATDATTRRCREARIQSYTRRGDYLDNEHILRSCRSAFRNDLNCLRALRKWHVDREETDHAASLAREIEDGFPGSDLALPDPKSSAD